MTVTVADRQQRLSQNVWQVALSHMCRWNRLTKDEVSVFRPKAKAGVCHSKPPTNNTGWLTAFTLAKLHAFCMLQRLLHMQHVTSVAALH